MIAENEQVQVFVQGLIGLNSLDLIFGYLISINTIIAEDNVSLVDKKMQ